jgi:hypothetical protein
MNSQARPTFSEADLPIWWLAKLSANLMESLYLNFYTNIK